MRLAPVSLLVGGAGLVAAIPLKLIVVERIKPVSVGRIGFAAANPNVADRLGDSPAAVESYQNQFKDSHHVPAEHIALPEVEALRFDMPLNGQRKPHDCGKNRKTSVLAKVERLSEFFRKLLGFEPVGDFDVHPHMRLRPASSFEDASDRPVHGSAFAWNRPSESTEEDKVHGDFHILPFMPGPSLPQEGPAQSQPAVDTHGASMPPPPVDFRGRHRMWMHRHRPHTFFGRLHKALFTLSPWEGRALSFVVGCGIGVLLRMLYVFSVLAFRFFFWQPRVRLEEDNQDEQENVQEVDGPTVVEQDDSAKQPLMQPPPEYEYSEKTDSQ